MAFDYTIGGVPTQQNVSALCVNMAHFLENTHQQAELYWRILAQTLADDDQKNNAGLDVTTNPGNKTRLDTAASVMLQIKNLLEGAAASQITDTRDFVAQLVGPLG